MSKKQKIIVVLGPTASGKSDLGVLLALRLNSGQAKKIFNIKGAEIISADSRQVYRGLDIGTGKITKREMKAISHHLLDVASPKKQFSVTQYQKLGKQAISKIIKKGKIPIIVGGTGLYIDSLIYDYPLPNVKPNPKLRKELEKLSTEQLFTRLQKRDSRRAANIDSHNRPRLIRALEILSEGPIPSYESVLKKESPYDVIKIGIKKDPEELKLLIKKRLEKRLRQGLVGEVENLLKKKLVSHKRLEELGLEYRYVSRHLRGEMTKKEMVEALKKEIYKYAKRQMTWFKRDKEIRWI